LTCWRHMPYKKKLDLPLCRTQCKPWECHLKSAWGRGDLESGCVILGGDTKRKETSEAKGKELTIEVWLLGLTQVTVLHSEQVWL
jgi:hypothetical protein